MRRSFNTGTSYKKTLLKLYKVMAIPTPVHRHADRSVIKTHEGRTDSGDEIVEVSCSYMAIKQTNK
jgi:hypothetical protein